MVLSRQDTYIIVPLGEPPYGGVLNMALRVQDENDLLTAIYDGPVEQPLWSTFLERLRVRVGADYAGIIFRPPDRPMGNPIELFSGRRSPPEVRRLYREDFHERDPFPHFDLRPERVYALSELLDDRDPVHNAFMRDILIPSGMREMRIVKVLEPGGVAASLSISRNKPDFSAADSALLSALAQHLRRALRNYALLERERFRTSIASHAIRRLNFGWISLDARVKIIEADPNAERLLQQSGELRRGRQDRLIIADPVMDRRLTETIRNFASEEMKRPRAIRASQDPWVDMLLVPVEARSRNAAATAVAVAYIQGDSRSAADGHEEIAELFGLLPSEARLALALSRGFSISEAAVELGITIETARSYSKKVYAKLGARGQADLVRFVLASVLALT